MIVLHGMDQMLAALNARTERMRAASREATAKALHLIERRTKEKLGEQSHQPGTPTPAGPGEPPALVTGNLRRSITVTGPESTGLNSWRGQVGPTAVYGRVQELGGPTGRGTLPARPYLQPAFDDIKPQLQAIFTAAWTKAIL